MPRGEVVPSEARRRRGPVTRRISVRARCGTGRRRMSPVVRTSPPPSRTSFAQAPPRPRGARSRRSPPR